jgi:hypothetical protein
MGNKIPAFFCQIDAVAFIRPTALGRTILGIDDVKSSKEFGGSALENLSYKK